MCPERPLPLPFLSTVVIYSTVCLCQLLAYVNVHRGFSRSFCCQMIGCLITDPGHNISTAEMSSSLLCAVAEITSRNFWTLSYASLSSKKSSRCLPSASNFLNNSVSKFSAFNAFYSAHMNNRSCKNRLSNKNKSSQSNWGKSASLSHNYATKSPLVTMGRPNSTQKLSLPLKTTHLVHLSLDWPHSPPHMASSGRIKTCSTLVS